MSRDTLKNAFYPLRIKDINKNLYEVLVIDDGSFDNSRKIVKKLQEKYSNISMYHKQMEDKVLLEIMELNEQ